jgi:hypothetical protein
MKPSKESKSTNMFSNTYDTVEVLRPMQTESQYVDWNNNDESTTIDQYSQMPMDTTSRHYKSWHDAENPEAPHYISSNGQQ